MKNSGFTLLELMIAIFFVTFLAVFTSQSIRTSIREKNKMKKNMDQESRIRSAEQVMERDLSMAFHSQGLIELMNQQAAAATNQTGQPGVPPPTPFPGQPPQPFQAPRPAFPNASAQKKPNWTQFWGDENKISFTSRSNVRLIADSPESDLAKIGYEVKGCGGTMGNEVGHIQSCLWRRISPVIDDQIDQGGIEQILLENVKEFKLSYLGYGKEDWQSKWYTDNRGDAVTTDKFPIAVRIHIVTEEDRNGKPREMSADTVAILRFPNNDSPQNPTSPSGTPQPTTPQVPPPIPPRTGG